MCPPGFRCSLVLIIPCSHFLLLIRFWNVYSVVICQKYVTCLTLDFGGKVSQCSPGYCRTHFVARLALSSDLLASASPAEHWH